MGAPRLHLTDDRWQLQKSGVREEVNHNMNTKEPPAQRNVPHGWLLLFECIYFTYTSSLFYSSTICLNFFHSSAFLYA
jgi:hypothetical protein